MKDALTIPPHSHTHRKRKRKSRTMAERMEVGIVGIAKGSRTTAPQQHYHSTRPELIEIMALLPLGVIKCQRLDLIL